MKQKRPKQIVFVDGNVLSIKDEDNPFDTGSKNF